MKKIIVSILAFLYIGTSSGATVYLHYCMGHFTGISLVEGKNSKCDECGMNKSAKGKNCCKDEQKFIKLDKDQKTTDQAGLYHFYKSFTAEQHPHTFYSVSNIPSIIETHPVSNAPPRSQQVDLYLLHCLFLI